MLSPKQQKAEYDRLYRQINREKRRAQDRARAFRKRETSSKWRERNLEKVNRKGRERYRKNGVNEKNKRRIHEKVKFVRAEKLKRGCENCGYQEFSRLLHWHHKDPGTKKFNLVYAFQHGWRAIFAEIAKCFVLCEKCHLEKEAEKRRNRCTSAGARSSPGPKIIQLELFP